MSRKLKRRQDLRVFASTAGFQSSGKLEDFVISRPAIDNLDGFHVSAATFALWGLPGVRKGLRLDHGGRSPAHEHEILVEFNGPAVQADAKAHLDALRDIVASLNPTAVLCRTANWWTGALLDLQTELRAASKPCPHMYFNLPGGSLNTFFSRTGGGSAIVGVWPDRVPRQLDENSLDATVLEPKASRVIEHRRDSRRLMVLHPGAVGMTRFRETAVNYAAVLGHTRHLIDEAPLLPE